MEMKGDIFQVDFELKKSANQISRVVLEAKTSRSHGYQMLDLGREEVYGKWQMGEMRSGGALILRSLGDIQMEVCNRQPARWAWSSALAPEFCVTNFIWKEVASDST